jgi:hypothetical protein
MSTTASPAVETTTESTTLALVPENEAPECYGVKEGNHATPLRETVEESIVMGEGISKVRKLDPYSGFFSDKSSARSVKKKKVDESVVVHNGVVVSYTKDTMPKEIEKYYFQRYAYFSKFDQGVLMDKGKQLDK